MEKHVMQYQTVHFNLNGKDVERTVDVRASLTDMLRNDFRMTSVKKEMCIRDRSWVDTTWTSSTGIPTASATIWG